MNGDMAGRHRRVERRNGNNKLKKKKKFVTMRDEVNTDKDG